MFTYRNSFIQQQQHQHQQSNHLDHHNSNDNINNNNNKREIIKETIVNYITIGCDNDNDNINNNNNDDQLNWEKCRLLLVKNNDNDVIMLEFYTLTNLKSPKCGLYCNLFDEIRQTKSIEMPERPYTAVIRIANYIEYIIEFNNSNELFDWIRIIRSQIPKQSHNDNDDDDDNRIIRSDIDYVFDMLNVYPWFHPNVNRLQATEIVMSGGEQWSGVFLLRKSQTHYGECVLTFNYFGRQAKHFRIIIKQQKGGCQMEQLCFRSIIDLLKYFRKNPIPLRHHNHHHQQQNVEISLKSFVVFDDKSNNNDNRNFRRSFIQLMDNAHGWLTSSYHKQSSSSTIDNNNRYQISNESVSLTREQLSSCCL